MSKVKIIANGQLPERKKEKLLTAEEVEQLVGYAPEWKLVERGGVFLERIDLVVCHKAKLAR